MTDQALLICPFCDERPFERWEDNINGPKYPGHYFVWCDNLDCDVSVEVMEETKEAAYLAWNTRPPSERPVAQMGEALEKARKLMSDELDAGCSLGTLRKTWNEVESCIAAALTAERPEAGMIQANSIASEKVCDHPSTEKAVASLVEFFKWSIREGPWDGCDLDGASVQDKAESLGLIIKTQYEPEIHGQQSDLEVGDDYFVFSAAISTALLIANPENLHGSEPEIKEAWYVEVGQQGSGPFDRTTIETGPRGQGIVVATVNTMLPEAIASARKLIALANASEPSLLGRETVREALESWLAEQIAQAASQQAQSYSMAGEYGQRQGERWHARQVALYETKLKLVSLSPLPLK